MTVYVSKTLGCSNHRSTQKLQNYNGKVTCILCVDRCSQCYLSIYLLFVCLFQIILTFLMFYLSYLINIYLIERQSVSVCAHAHAGRCTDDWGSQERTLDPPWARVAGYLWANQCGCWELNWGPVEKDQAIPAAPFPILIRAASVWGVALWVQLHSVALGRCLTT